ncbi:MAG: glycosyltransferase [Deltaproteobacteria bacterium]|nr:glycosyltransferase [Deltaproteobacteria bacterium]
MKKRVLIIAGEFPPFKTIGRIRTVKWCQHLPALGWEPAVLTLAGDSPGPRDEATLEEIPEGTQVFRATWPRPKETVVGLVKSLLGKIKNETQSSARINNSASIKEIQKSGSPDGKPFRASDLLGIWDHFARTNLLIPDSYLLWSLTAIHKGLQAINTFQPHVIFATAPPFTDLLVGSFLSRWSGIPWIADYRDLWTGDVLREWVPGWRQSVEIALERHLLKSAAAVVTVSKPKTQFMRKRVPSLPADRFYTITNGYDPDEYEDLTPEGQEPGVFRFVYTGRLFKNRRGYELLEAMGQFFERKPEMRGKFRVEYYGGVAPEIAERMDNLIRTYGLEDMICFHPDVPFQKSKALQKGADVLLLIVDTGETTSGVIPGKLFEYVATKRPILCISKDGATSEIIRKGKLGWVIKPGDVEGIINMLSSLIEVESVEFNPEIQYLSQFERKKLASSLNMILEFAATKHKN